MTTDTPTEPVTEHALTFPNHYALRVAEAALKRDTERQDAFRRLVDIVNPGPREFVNRFVTLDHDTHVYEIGEGNEPPLYGVIHQNSADHERFYGLEEALLRAIALRAGARDSDRGHIYAARALGVRPTVDVQEARR